MNKIREELNEILLETYRLRDLNELLEDYFSTKLCQEEYSKGDTLATLVVAKIKEISKSLEDLYSLEGNN